MQVRGTRRPRTSAATDPSPSGSGTQRSHCRIGLLEVSAPLTAAVLIPLGSRTSASGPSAGWRTCA